MPPAPRSRLLRRGALTLAVLTGLALPGPVSAADLDSATASVGALSARVEAVAAELAAATARYEQGQAELGAGLTAEVAAERAAERSDARRVAARDAVRRVVAARYRDPVPDGLRLLVSRASGAPGDTVATQVVLARVQQAQVDTLRAASADRSRALADADALTASRVERAALASRLDGELEALRVSAARTGAELETAYATLRRAQAAERRRAEQQAAERQAQQRSAQQQAAAAAAAGPWQPLPGGPPCSAATTADYPNGFVDDAALCPLRAAPGHRLQGDAARSFDAMSADYAAQSGEPLCVTDSYRSYAAQVQVFRTKPTLAAVPGTSNHGRGLAVDLCGGAQTFDGAAHRWLQAHAPRFGWVHPSWAEPGGSRPEPWHWEFGRL